jgi:hypothetical protein
MATRLDSLKPNLTTSIFIVNGENHGSVIPMVLNRGLRFALEKETK